MPSAPRRRTSISAIEELAPRREGPLHVGWQVLRGALRGSGVAPDLVRRSFHARLGPHARVCPTQQTIFELIDSYLLGDALGRVSEGRYVAHREGERESARGIVARIRRALPELGMLALADESRHGHSHLLLRVPGSHVEVAPEQVEVDEWQVGDARYMQRTVTVEGLVEAANELLAMKGAPFRFLPLNAPDDVDAYLAIDEAGAEMLDRVGFWAAPVEELRDFARWNEPVEDAAQVA